MPDGTRYDGRFNLTSELRSAEINGIKTGDPAAMAHWYGVTLEEYLAGQEWARKHLADLRREAGLDPDTGLPMEPTNGTEPQPGNGTEPQLAPRGNGHKASMVAHRVQR